MQQGGEGGDVGGDFRGNFAGDFGAESSFSSCLAETDLGGSVGVIGRALTGTCAACTFAKPHPTS